MFLKEYIIMLSIRCSVCDSLNTNEIFEYNLFIRVTSDCKPFKDGGHLWECSNCSFVFKNIDNKFLSEISNIYTDYDVYYQGGGSEQIVFSEKFQCHLTRSDIICKNLLLMDFLAKNGEFIDVGCGNGKFLKSFNKYFDKWSLYGLEIHDKHKDELRYIQNFKNLLVDDINNIEGVYDLISLNHTLEHLVDPIFSLKILSKNIKKNGFLFIQVPDSELNPYDFLIADHVSHFSKKTLENMLIKAGYEIININNDWITKEICCLCRYNENKVDLDYNISHNFAMNNINYLINIIYKTKYWSEKSELFGLFGTSIASVWLSIMFGEKIIFYVDEDLNRQGRNFFGKKILSPSNVQNGSIIFMPMIDNILNSIRSRLKNICLGKLVGPNDQ